MIYFNPIIIIKMGRSLCSFALQYTVLGLTYLNIIFSFH